MTGERKRCMFSHMTNSTALGDLGMVYEGELSDSLSDFEIEAMLHELNQDPGYAAYIEDRKAASLEYQMMFMDLLPF